jgi:hypothetical protein
MAWKVIGFHNAIGDCHGKGYKEGYRAVFFGPHPRKMWVKVQGERKPRKIASKSALTGRGTFDKADQERKACEYARWLARRDGVALPGDAKNPAYGKCFWNTAYLGKGKAIPIQPNALDVLHSLAMDSDVLDAGGFESWASDLGYDTDSRKAEQTYRACLDLALKLRAALGDSGLSDLRNAFEGY